MKNRESVLKDLRLSLKRTNKLLPFLLIGSIFLWFASGIFVVRPEEEAVVRRWGRVVRKKILPGIHYRLPYPVEKCDKVATKKVRRIYIGGEEARKVEEVHPFLIQRITGDINIVNFRLLVQYRVKDVSKWLFSLKNSGGFLKNTLETTALENVSKISVDEALTVGKLALQEKIMKEAQEELDYASSGTEILSVNISLLGPPQEVGQAFADVSTGGSPTIDKRSRGLPGKPGKRGSRKELLLSFSFRKIQKGS